MDNLKPEAETVKQPYASELPRSGGQSPMDSKLMKRKKEMPSKNISDFILDPARC